MPQRVIGGLSGGWGGECPTALSNAYTERNAAGDAVHTLSQAALQRALATVVQTDYQVNKSSRQGIGGGQWFFADGS